MRVSTFDGGGLFLAWMRLSTGCGEVMMRTNWKKCSAGIVKADAGNRVDLISNWICTWKSQVCSWCHWRPASKRSHEKRMSK